MAAVAPKLVPNGWVDVTAYGADPNGINDSSTAVQAAIDALDSIYGGTVYFPPGKYKIVTGLTIRKGGVRLQGAGSTEYWTSGTDYADGSYLVTGTSSMTLLDVAPSNTTIIHGGPIVEALGFVDVAGSSTLVNVRLTNNASFKDCFFGNATVGLQFDSDTDTTASGDASYGQVSHCTFRVNTTGLKLLGAGSVPTVHVTGCHFASNGSAGIDINQSAYFNRIIGNKFEVGSGGTGIKLNAGLHNTIADSMFELTASSAVGIDVGVGTTNLVDGTAIMGCGFYGQTTNGTGIKVNGGSGGTAKLGSIIGCSFHAITTGITLGQYSERFTVSACTIRTATTGISIASGATNHSLVGIKSNLSLANTISDSGTGTVVKATTTTDGNATDTGASSGAPTDVDYLVGTASGSLSGEIVVGTTPGGELGGTWASPTVDTVHSGSSHAATQAAAEATASAALTAALAAGQGNPTGREHIYVSGRFYRSPGTLTTQAMTQSRLYYVPIVVYSSVSINGLSIDVSGAAAGSTCRLGIYTANTSTYAPKDLVVEATGTVDSTGTGQKDLSASASLTRGLYYLAVVAQGGTPTLRAIGNDYDGFVGITTGNFAQGTFSWIEASVTGALPANATPTYSNTAGAPAVFMKVA